MIIEVPKTLSQGERRVFLETKLPFYVSTTTECFLVKDVSNTILRDKERIEMFALSTKEMQAVFPEGTRKLKFSNNHIISTEKGEAEIYYKEKRALRIQEKFPYIERKYLEYQKFMDENSMYFI